MEDGEGKLRGSLRFIVYPTLIQSQAWESLRTNLLNVCEVCEVAKSQFSLLGNVCAGCFQTIGNLTVFFHAESKHIGI